jgi:D-serine deaminase-like pyridoxal phosphate-dependent protein
MDLDHEFTPCLFADLPQLEANLLQLRTRITAAGKNWRPHLKCHKIPALAWKQLRLGAIGITAAKLSEAEVFAQAGITDILLAHLVVGETSCQRAANLARETNLIVTIDHYAQAEPLALACRDRGVTCRVLVEVNLGMNRSGVRPGQDALELAKGVDRLSGLKLVGIMGYEGHTNRIAEPDFKRQAMKDSMGIVTRTKEEFQKAGLSTEVVSTSGSAQLELLELAESSTEIQAGGLMFGDPYYDRMCAVPGYPPALFVKATVVSRPALERAVLNVGRKGIATEFYPPTVHKYPHTEVGLISAEHTVLQLCPDGQKLLIGDTVNLIVGYSDFTVMLYDELLGVREGEIEARWPIAARGKLV